MSSQYDFFLTLMGFKVVPTQKEATKKKRSKK